MKLGIFGGTFNPIHVGHLLLAETAREACSLDRVLFIPNRQPPHKRPHDLLPGSTRLALIRLAVRGHPAFIASELELNRLGPSYMIDTVTAIRQRAPRAKLFLLIGEDMLAVRWYAWERLKRLCTIVVAHRAGTSGGRRESGLKRFPMPQVEISSSEIRARVKAGRSIRYLVPESVERYIHQHRLYHGSRP